jgi:hypothetical protein
MLDFKIKAATFQSYNGKFIESSFRKLPKAPFLNQINYFTFKIDTLFFNELG